MPRARITRPLRAAPAVAPPARPAHPKNLGDWAAAAASNNDTHMIVVEDRTAEAELPLQPDNFVDTALCIKIKANPEVIFVSGWGVFIQQYQFNELDNCMSKTKKGSKREQVSGRNSGPFFFTIIIREREREWVRERVRENIYRV